jgi:hypothetical protein
LLAAASGDYRFQRQKKYVMELPFDPEDLPMPEELKNGKKR